MKIPEGLIDALKEASESIREDARGPLSDELYGYACMLAAAPAPLAQESVKIPTSADEAELMAKLGLTWLEQNAPERLKTPQAQYCVAQLITALDKAASALEENNCPNSAHQARQAIRKVTGETNWFDGTEDAEGNPPPAQDNQWQQAVLNECMAIEGCYKESDPVGTVKCLIDWHVMNERNHAQDAEPVVLQDHVIQAVAVNCGFRLRDQPDGSFDLNPYVYDFAREIQSLCCPDTSELQKAAEELLYSIYNADVGDQWFDKVENLRAALGKGRS